MRFTYLDILEQCFRDKFRGYNKQEVDTFLHLVANDFKAMSEETEQLKENLNKTTDRNSSLEKKLKELESKYSTGHQETLDKISEIHQKAQHILKQAQNQANLKCKDAEKELNRIREEIKLLKGERQSLLENLKAGAKAYLESIYKNK